MDMIAEAQETVRTQGTKWRMTKRTLESMTSLTLDPAIDLPLKGDS
jgi:hypothetical protein